MIWTVGPVLLRIRRALCGRSRRLLAKCRMSWRCIPPQMSSWSWLADRRMVQGGGSRSMVRVCKGESRFSFIGKPRFALTCAAP